MKRFNKTILFFLVVTLLTLTFTGCGKKVALTASDFKSKMEYNSYTIKDATDQFNSEEIESVYLAMNDDYQIEFYVFSNENQAINVYNQNKADFEKTKGSTNLESSISLGNSSKYTLKSGGTYKVLSRIDASWIYINADNTYAAEIDGVLKELGY